MGGTIYFYIRTFYAHIIIGFIVSMPIITMELDHASKKNAYGKGIRKASESLLMSLSGVSYVYEFMIFGK